MSQRTERAGKRRIEFSISGRTMVLLVIAASVGAILLLALPARGRRIELPVISPYAVTDSQFLRALGALAGPPAAAGNRLTALQNGDETFPAMLDAIRGAARTITFETSFFHQDTMTRRFADALIERARAGVRIHVLVDWMGVDDAGHAALDRMREAGVDARIYHRPKPWQPRRLNNRTHRRVLVIDGRTGFTGGVCVADTWMGDAQNRDHWRDTHFRLEGPAVANLQAAFMDNWRDEVGEVLHDERYFPALDSVGPLAVQIVMSSPDEGSENLRLVYMLALAAARSSVLVQNPYFVPDDMMRDALVSAARRGVAVVIMLPADSVTDARVTQRASRSRWQPLLEAGVRLYLYQPTLLHQKIMIVDSVFVTAGSANFDYRSFRLNDEVNLTVMDSAFARHLARAFEADLRNSQAYTLDDWGRRSWWDKLTERAAGLIRHQF